MKIKVVLFFALFILQGTMAWGAPKATLVHNTHQEIKARTGKLELKLVRVWGGEAEEDEQKFFETPRAVVVAPGNEVYISDEHNNHIKVFDWSGKYLRTIGRKGRGPGDVYGPNSIALSSGGALWVGEAFGRRVQLFGVDGKSKEIFKVRGFVTWMGVTSDEEVAVYALGMVLRSGRLVAINSKKGKKLREIGVYHSQRTNYSTAERHEFAIDHSDHIYAANVKTPVIRKYSADGRLKRVITFEPPPKIPVNVKISLAPDGNEIMYDNGSDQGEERIKEKEGGATIQVKQDKNKKYRMCHTIAVDRLKRLYVVSRRRLLTEEEKRRGKDSYVTASPTRIDRKRINFELYENWDIYRLLVFSPGGKVVAETCLTKPCQKIYVHGNRLFLIDGTIFQHILEYEMSFKE